jgi:peptide/nickel transport system ATP-binding protein
MNAPVVQNSMIRVANLSVWHKDQCLVEPVSFELHRNARLTLLGETGSGKSLLMQAIMGTLPKNLTAKGELWIDGQTIPLNNNAKKPAQQPLWGHTLSVLPQEPWKSLDPLMPVKKQLQETFRWVKGESASRAAQLANQSFEDMGLKGSEDKRVRELSGGMAQRVAIRCAMAGGATLLLADEPTKGLDASRRDQAVKQLIEQTEGGALITITHDVDVAHQLEGEIWVMKAGKVIETGSAKALLSNPKDPFTQSLIQAHSKALLDNDSYTVSNTPVVKVENLTLTRGGRTLQEGVSFTLHQGEILGVMGDSGCGKSTLGDSLLGLCPSSGKIEVCVSAKPYQWTKLYQDPVSSVADHVPLRTLLADLIKLHKLDATRIPMLLTSLGLSEEILDRTANSVSGGELQRFCLLRALILNPVFLFADEPTSRLDPETSREVSKLLVAQSKQHHCAVMVVSHDLAWLNAVCDRVITLNSPLA